MGHWEAQTVTQRFGWGGSKSWYETYLAEVFVILKTYPLFLNYFSTTSFAIALKVSFSKRKRIFLFMESVQISP